MFYFSAMYWSLPLNGLSLIKLLKFQKTKARLRIKIWSLPCKGGIWYTAHRFGTVVQSNQSKMLIISSKKIDSTNLQFLFIGKLLFYLFNLITRDRTESIILLQLSALSSFRQWPSPRDTARSCVVAVQDRPRHHTFIIFTQLFKTWAVYTKRIVSWIFLRKNK